MATLVRRALGAARLDAGAYEDVEHDPAALGQALLVVLVASIGLGVGSAGYAGDFALGELALGIVVNLGAWFVWAAVTWWIGTRLLPTTETEADLGQLLRTIGFSATPGALAALGFLPVVGGLIALAAALWQLAAMVVAVRQALDYQSTGRAIAVCAIGFLAYLLVAAVLLGGLFAVVR